MNRREFLRHLSLTAAAVTAGCQQIWVNEPVSGGGAAIIDAHCHVFNASDLPAARFLRQVAFHDYPKEAYRVLGTRDEDMKDMLINLTLRLLGADKAPTAKQEIAYLNKSTGKLDLAASRQAALESAIDDTSDYLIELDQRDRGVVTMGVEPDLASKPVSKERKFLQLILGEQQAKTLSFQPMTKSMAQRESRRLFFSLDPIGRYLSWFGLLRMYRHQLVDQLVADMTRQGFKPLLLTPLLVDYDEWLFQDVVASPLRAQAAVMDLISQRAARASDGPVVHGFMGFDPLREVVYRHLKHTKKNLVSSLETVEAALLDHGFLGVKLYPPMGFRPLNNAGGYPKRTTDVLGSDPSKGLDAALRDLYRLCVKHDAPIIAHGSASNAAGQDTAGRGDAKYWIPVFKEFPELRVCLAHFGSFEIPKAERNKGLIPLASWEWRLGEFIKKFPHRNIYADISYFSEVFKDKEKREPFARNFKLWADTFDPELDHIVYGSDWIMLGKEEGYEHYLGSVNSFLREDCQFSDDICDKIFRRNALRFLPLEKWSRGRNRMLKYYSKNGLDERRLPEANPRAIADLVGR